MSQSWLELSVVVEREAVEPVTELFVRYGYNQGVVIEEPVTPGPDGGVVLDENAPVTLRIYLPVNPELPSPLTPLPEVDGNINQIRLSEDEGNLKVGNDENLQKLREGLWHLGRMLHIEDLKIEERQEEDWANAWKEFYQVHRIARRTVIKPPWQPYEPDSDDIVIEIDPGMAFGTGLHPTTRLCLMALEDYMSAGAGHGNPAPIVLDLGTGSGILAIAAAKLGAEKVIAVDTDPVATKAARENVERNQLSTIITVATGSLAIEQSGTVEGGFYSFKEEEQRTPPELAAAKPFDVIVANIIARIIAALAPALAQALKPGGLLICSGIIEERAAETLQALEEAGLTLVEQRQEGDWVALIARL